VKDLLFITSSRNRVLHVEAGKQLATAIQEQKEGVKQLLDTTWLLTGPKSFEIVLLLRSIAAEYDLPVVVVEVEAVLSPAVSETPTPPES